MATTMSKEEQVEASLEDWRKRRNAFLWKHRVSMNLCCPSECILKPLQEL